MERGKRLHAWLGSNRSRPVFRFSRWGGMLAVLGLSGWFMWAKLSAGYGTVTRSDICFSAWQIGVSGVCVTLSSLIGAFAWTMLVRALGSSLDLVHGMRIHSVSNLVKYVPGFIWPYAGKAYLAIGRGVPPGIAALSVLTEFAILFVSGGIVLLLCLPFSGLVAWSAFQSLWFQSIATLLVAMVIAGLPMVGRKLADRFARVRPTWKFVGQIDWNQLVLVLLFFLLAWCLLAFAFSVLDTFEPFPWAGLSRRAFALVSALLVGQVVVFVPMGIGVRESMFVTLLGYVRPAAFVLVAALVFRLEMMIGEAVLALAMVLWGKVAARNVNNTKG